MKRAWFPWAVAAGTIAAAQPLVKQEHKAPVVSATPGATLVKATAAEAVSRYGKNLAGNLKGVRAVCED